MNEDLAPAVEAVTRWLDRWLQEHAPQTEVWGPEERHPSEPVRWTLHTQAGPSFHLCFDKDLLTSEPATLRMLAELEDSGWMGELGERDPCLVVIRGAFKPNSRTCWDR